jgi:hypothetical protein
MLKTSAVIITQILAASLAATTAGAVPRQKMVEQNDPHAGWMSPIDEAGPTRATGASRAHAPESRGSGLGPRPGKWCGWYMRSRRGGGPEYNVAWNWRNYGSPASPQVGAIVVWRHHVGEITGQAPNGQWIVLSGNDGGRVRERPRSIAGAIVRM